MTRLCIVLCVVFCAEYIGYIGGRPAIYIVRQVTGYISYNRGGALCLVPEAWILGVGSR